MGGIWNGQVTQDNPKEFFIEWSKIIPSPYQIMVVCYAKMYAIIFINIFAETIFEKASISALFVGTVQTKIRCVPVQIC